MLQKPFTFGLYCKYWLIRELQPLQLLDKDIDIFYDAFIKRKGIKRYDEYVY